MPYVITDRCLGERYATCAEVCPVDCIHPGDYKGEEFMIIDPDDCIDCGVCQPECPVNAIVDSADESPEWAKINAELAPAWKGAPKVTPRAANEPPRKASNKK